MRNGWISLHRKLLDKPIWKNSTPEQKVILITLLLLANHEDAEWDWGGKRFKVGKGEFVTSLESIRKSAGKQVSIQQIRTAIDRFKTMQFLTYKATKSGRIITILNYCKYQPTPNGDQQREKQTGNKQVTTNNKDNNAIKLKYKVKVPIPENIYLTPEMANYAKSKNWTQDAEVEFERFATHHKSKGSKFNDWYAAFQKWVQNDIKWHPEHKGQEMVDL